MKTRTILFYCLAALLGGCVPIVSLHPLFTDDTLVFDQQLIGVWADEPETTWEFARSTPSDANVFPDALKGEGDKVYRLDFQGEEGHKGAFLACLVKLGDKALRAAMQSLEFRKVQTDDPNFIAPGPVPFIITTEHLIVG